MTEFDPSTQEQLQAIGDLSSELIDTFGAEEHEGEFKTAIVPLGETALVGAAPEGASPTLRVSQPTDPNAAAWKHAITYGMQDGEKTRRILISGDSFSGDHGVISDASEKNRKGTLSRRQAGSIIADLNDYVTIPESDPGQRDGQETQESVGLSEAPEASSRRHPLDQLNDQITPHIPAIRRKIIVDKIEAKRSAQEARRKAAGSDAPINPIYRKGDPVRKHIEARFSVEGEDFTGTAAKFKLAAESRAIEKQMPKPERKQRRKDIRAAARADLKFALKSRAKKS